MSKPFHFTVTDHFDDGREIKDYKKLRVSEEAGDRIAELIIDGLMFYYSKPENQVNDQEDLVLAK